MWRTLNTRSVLAHVREPGHIQLALGLFEHAECKHLDECLIGRPPVAAGASKANDHRGVEDVRSEPRLVDGAYTELDITWRGIHFRVRSAVIGQELVLRVDPDPDTLPLVPPLLTLQLALLWNAEGSLERHRDRLAFRTAAATGDVFATAAFADEAVAELAGVHACLRLDAPIGVSTGHPLDLESIDRHLAEARSRRDQCLARFGPHEVAELAGVVHSALGWTGVHDPRSRQTVTTVSRVWASRNNGAVLFCWDSFFAAMMAQAVGETELACGNLEAITRPVDALGYVPNVLNAAGSASFGHSQPPVGAFALRYVAAGAGQPELAEPLLDRLLAWNRWWPRNRVHDGFLCWGSRREPPRVGGSYEEQVTGGKSGAQFESGLDNAPIFDDASYDEATGLLLQADVGLHALYVRDCLDLAALCQQAGRSADAAELRERATHFLAQLDTLWDPATGIHRDRDLRTGSFSRHLSPCNFYPLLTGAIAPDKVHRILDDHFHNPDEFAGDYILPSIARNDPAYPEQDYWRGRIWAPMNFLVYAGLLTSGCEAAASQLAAKGNTLLLRNWRERGFVGENYNAETGRTGERANSDPFNPWGALLGLVGLMDAGAVPRTP